MAVVLLEGEDIGAAMGAFATSQEPFDVWFRDVLMDVHGIDLAGDAPGAEQILDYRA